MIQAMVYLLVASLLGSIPLFAAFGFAELVRRWGG